MLDFDSILKGFYFGIVLCFILAILCSCGKEETFFKEVSQCLGDVKNCCVIKNNVTYCK